MTILCAGDCHVFLGSSSLCTCEAHRVAMYGLPISYNPFSPHATPPTAADLPDVARLRSAERAGAGWLSADGLRCYCQRYGETLEAGWNDEARNFGAWSVRLEGLPDDAVRM